jgi:hypothetical protein
MQNEPAVQEPKKKRKGWSRFVNFLVYGGWILIMLLIVGIVVAVSSITGC